MLSSLPHSGCLGVILAGGASRRMGHDKATLPWGNSTLLDHMRALLFKAGVDRVVILGKPDVEDGVADETPFAGPVPALLSYLRAAGAGQRHVVVPIDMPYLSPALLAPLASVTHWTRYDGYVFPFTAIGGEIVSGSGPRLRDLLSANKATLLTVPAFADRAFRNLNHLGDLPYSHPAHANERCCQ
ncbi:molybdenum cofactor guanylyltransferase [Kordiimonas sp.]|uniref:molybdenum cofactor guanylyltransferase n=1 Tax=Kordiimonas sp. TaxID=1970157 RepID=UPI003A934CAC